VILDNVGNRPLRLLRRRSTPAVRQRLRFLPTRQDRAELTAVTALVDEGKLRPVVDRTYPLADVAAALCQVEEGHTRGKIVITIA
jgi:NADPH:quinone reductase-like Zn-dependent oxidoreductase